MNALIYARVSTDEQKDAATIDVQIETCRAHAARMGWAVADVFADDGVSGTIALTDRPQGARLLAAANKDTAIIILCVDRLTRDGETGIPAYNKLVKLSGGNVNFVNQSVDDTVDGKMTFGIFLVIAEWERGTIRRRTMKGKQDAIRKDKIHAAATPAYGYRRVTVIDDDGRPVLKDNGRVLTRVEVRPDTAAVVRRVFELYLSGTGPDVINTTLQREGIPAPSAAHKEDNPNAKHVGRGWHRGRVLEILKRQAYTGVGVYNPGDPNREGRKLDETIETAYPPIISPDTYIRAQELMDGRKTGPRKGRLFILQGKTFCFCGARLSPSGGKARGKSGKMYRCGNRQHNRGFPSVVEAHKGKKWSWPAEMLETLTKRFVNAWFADPTRLAPHLEQVYRAEQAAIESEANEVNGLRAKLAELKSRKDNILDLAERGLDKDTVVERLAAIDKEQVGIEKRLAVATRKAVKQADKVDMLLRMRGHLLARLVGRDVDDVLGEMPMQLT